MMTLRKPGVGRLAMLGMSLALAPSPGRAEVTRVDIQRREDVLGGRAFGSAGPYEEPRLSIEERCATRAD